MPKLGPVVYDLKELTAFMLRDQGIRSGLWMLWTKWTFGATNIAPPEDQPGGAVGPGAVVVLTEVGIQRVEEPGPLTVDAAEVWKGKKPAARQKAGARPDKEPNRPARSHREPRRRTATGPPPAP